MTTAQKLAQNKAEKLGTDVEPVLAYQLNLLDALDHPEGFDNAGNTLSKAGRWAATSRDKAEQRSVKILERATKLHDQALWRSMKFDSDAEVPASQLLQAQQLVRDHFSVRRDEMIEELDGKGEVADEVIAGGTWQAAQVKVLFDAVADRLASTALGAAEESGLEVGRLINSGWRRLLTPFYQTHVLMFTALEVGDLVGGARKGARLLDFSALPADEQGDEGGHFNSREVSAPCSPEQASGTGPATGDDGAGPA